MRARNLNRYSAKKRLSKFCGRETRNIGKDALTIFSPSSEDCLTGNIVLKIKFTSFQGTALQERKSFIFAINRRAQ